MQSSIETYSNQFEEQKTQNEYELRINSTPQPEEHEMQRFKVKTNNKNGGNAREARYSYNVMGITKVGGGSLES